MFGEDPEGSVEFHEATHLTPSDWGKLQDTRCATECSVTSTARALLERHVTDDMLTWQAYGGFSIDASVHIAARDRARARTTLALLCPSSLRPRTARGCQLRCDQEASASSIVFHIPHRMVARLCRSPPWSSSSGSLCSLLPPRIHRHRYHGVLAPNAGLRYQVIAFGREQGTAQESSSG